MPAQSEMRSTLARIRRGGSRKIGTRLVGYALAFALVISLSLSGFQLWQSRQDELLRVNQLLDQLVISSEPMLADVAWEEDQDRASQIANNFLKTTEVSYFLVQGKDAVLVELGSDGPDIIQRSITLTSRRGQKLAAPFGRFAVGVDMKPIYSRLQATYGGVLVRTALIIGLVIGFTLLLFRFMVTRHLTHISAFFASLTPETLDQLLVLNRKRPAPGQGDEIGDEFDSLVRGVNQMQAILASDIRRRELAESEVRQLNEDLENRVEQRTTQLQSSNQALESSLSELKAAQNQLIQSEKMASLGQLVANIAHEINTPIGAVKASGSNISTALDQTLECLPRLLTLLDQPSWRLFMSLVENARKPAAVRSSREERAITREITQQLETDGVAQARYAAGILVELQAESSLADYLPLLRHPESEFILKTAHEIATIISSASNINTAVDRVSKIIFALRSFSRADSEGEMSDAKLQDGIETVLTIYLGQMRQGTELIRNYDEIPSIKCLPDELNQVWTNLIHNALQAMNHKGTLTIGLRQEGNEAVVSVGDSGCGIPEAIRNRIFEPFFTTKAIGEGSGLGLDIVKKIIDKHKGRIEVQSEVGVGSTFSVRLPYAP